MSSSVQSLLVLSNVKESKAHLEEYVREEAPEQSSDNAIVGGGDGTTDHSQGYLKVVTSTNILTLQTSANK